MEKSFYFCLSIVKNLIKRYKSKENNALSKNYTKKIVLLLHSLIKCSWLVRTLVMKESCSVASKRSIIWRTLNVRIDLSKLTLSNYILPLYYLLFQCYQLLHILRPPKRSKWKFFRFEIDHEQYWFHVKSEWLKNFEICTLRVGNTDFFFS